MNSAIRAAIDAAALCSINVTIDLATGGGFHRAFARHAHPGAGTAPCCLRSDPLKAIQGAIDNLKSQTMTQ